MVLQEIPCVGSAYRFHLSRYPLQLSLPLLPRCTGSLLVLRELARVSGLERIYLSCNLFDLVRRAGGG